MDPDDPACDESLSLYTLSFKLNFIVHFLYILDQQFSLEQMDIFFLHLASS